MPSAHPAKSGWTRSEVIHVAVCSQCGNTPDDDGGEYRATPEAALLIARHLGFKEAGDRLLCEDCRCGSCGTPFHDPETWCAECHDAMGKL